MDIFEQQNINRNASRRLVAIYFLSVLATGITLHLVIALLFGFVNQWIGGTNNFPELVLNPGIAFWTLGISLAVIFIASIFKVIVLRLGGGGKAVAKAMNGREITGETTDAQEAMLLSVVEEMCIASGIGMPGVYVIDHETNMNAFAAGLSEKDSIVAVKKGLLDTLNRDELQGVIAHEFGHIIHGDTKVNTLLFGVLHGLFVLSLSGIGLVCLAGGLASAAGSLDNGKKSKSDDGGGTLGMMIILLIGALFVFVIGSIVWLVGVVSHLFGRLIQAAFSRKREYLADAKAVQLTRNPQGFANALKRIGGMYGLEHKQTVAISHMLFMSGFSNWFSTHPPLEERIRVWEPSFSID